MDMLDAPCEPRGREIGGILDTILQRLSAYIEKNVKLKRAVKSAMVYPVAVLAAFSVIIRLLGKVVPIFSTLFAGLEANLPPTSNRDCR